MADQRTSAQRFAEDPENARLLRQELDIVDVTEQICRLMDKEEISRKELAGRLGKSKSWVSRVLNGTTNFTLRTLSDFSTALERRLQVRLVPEESPTAAVVATEATEWRLHGKQGPFAWLSEQPTEATWI